MEVYPSVSTEPEALAGLKAFEPKLLARFIPSNGPEQKRAFLAGEIENPDHTYHELDVLNFAAQSHEIDIRGKELLADPSISKKFTSVYEDFIQGYQKKTEVMYLAHALKQAEDSTKRVALRDRYMALNTEIYGKPDEITYRSLLQEKMTHIAAKALPDTLQLLRNELMDMVGYSPTDPILDRFRPSNETVDWMHTVAESLYGGLLSHIPEQATFTPDELAAVFRTILREEFTGSADDWTVEVTDATTINVRASEKRIVIPIDRGNLALSKVRGLVVHEIGVHTLRAIQGYDTDLPMLVNGLEDYYDAEEGLGVVMEQALRGEFSESGIELYLTAGLAFCDAKDFRGIFDIKWRLALLDKANAETALTDDLIQDYQNKAYSSVMRCLRGTDELPWFKDLAYYNGAASMWKYLESIRGDDIKFMFMFMGKADPSNIRHERVLYETSTA